MALLALLGALQTPIDVFAALWVWICFAAVASLLVFLFVALWLYTDAASRGMGGALWVVILLVASFLFTFVGGLVVLVIYLVARMEHPVGAVPAGQVAYPLPYPPVPPPGPPVVPAAAAPSGPTTCKSCGAPVPLGAAFCANCGSKV